MQTYITGEEVRQGDHVRLGTDEGGIVAVEDALPQMGLSAEDSRRKAMIDLKRLGLLCDNTATNENLELVRRAPE